MENRPRLSVSTVFADKSPGRESSWRIRDYDKFMKLRLYPMELARVSQSLAIIRMALSEQGNLKYAKFLEFPDLIARLPEKRASQ